MAHMRRKAGFWAHVAVAGVLSSALGACGPGEVKAPNPTRALDERRAIEVIRKAVHDEGEEPTAARDEKVASGKTLRIDVGVNGHQFGIAYITSEDAEMLGDAIPPRNQKDEKLRITHGGDAETKVVLLYQDNYRYDDLVGEEHEQTAITAERALARDVRDFVTHAKTQKYK